MKRFTFAIGMAVGLTAMASMASAQVATFATNNPGSLAHRAGVAVAKVLQSKSDVKARVQPIGGSTTYTPMIARGEVTFGFSNAQEFLYAYKGDGTFEGKPHPTLRLVGMAFPLRAGIAVPVDSGLKKTTDLQNYKGKRITGEYTSLSIIEDYISSGLANGGVSYDDFQKVPVSGFVQGIKALGEGKTDITWISLGSGAGRQVMAQLKNRGGWRYLDFDTSERGIKAFKQHVPAGDIVLEKNTKMPGINEPTHIVQIRYLIATSADTDPDLVYKVTKTMAQNQPDLAKAFPAYRRLKVDQMAAQDGMPYHPGAVKAYKELNIPIAGN